MCAVYQFVLFAHILSLVNFHKTNEYAVGLGDCYNCMINRDCFFNDTYTWLCACALHKSTRVYLIKNGVTAFRNSNE